MPNCKLEWPHLNSWNQLSLVVNMEGQRSMKTIKKCCTYIRKCYDDFGHLDHQQNLEESQFHFPFRLNTQKLHTKIKHKEFLISAHYKNYVIILRASMHIYCKSLYRLCIAKFVCIYRMLIVLTDFLGLRTLSMTAKSLENWKF